jgi:tetratricopeptide (TPR) repeat protein
VWLSGQDAGVVAVVVALLWRARQFERAVHSGVGTPPFDGAHPVRLALAIDVVELLQRHGYQRPVSRRSPGGGGFPTHQAALEWVQAEQVGLVDAVVRASARQALPAVLLAADLMPCLQRVHAVDDYVRVGEAAVRLADDASVPEQVREVAYGNLRMALVVAERFDEAVAALDLAGDLMQRANPHHAAVTRMNLGVLHNQMQRFTQARTVMADLSTTFHDLDDKTNEASALLNMSNKLLWLGAFEEALAVFESARRLFEDLRDPHGCGQAWGGIGSVHRERRELPKAIAAYRRACAAHEDSGDRHSRAQAHGDLGDVLAVSGQAAEARTAYMQAAALYAAVNDHENAARVAAKA